MKAKLLVLGVGVALILGVVVSGAASGARAQPPAVVARQLVATLEKARTPAARYQAVLAMMKALRVPVFNAAGHAVAAGGSGFQKGFNLYDFQLRAAGESLGNKITLTDLAAALSGARRVDPAKLASSLGSGVAVAAAKPSPSSTLALVVRQLGLKQHPPVDLATKPAAAAIRLDPVQLLLLAVDAAEHKPVVAFRQPAVVRRSADFDCAVPGGSPESGPSLLGQGWQTVDAIGSDIATMKIVAGPSPALKTHYGPPGHADLAGMPVKVGVHVELTQHFPPNLRCGPLRTRERTRRPTQTIAGVHIDWTYDDPLPKYLKPTHVDSATDANGEARAELRPHNEKVPGFGQLVTKSGLITATATLPDVFRNYFLHQKASQLRIFVSQVAAVELHKPRGFKFQSHFAFTGSALGGGTGSISDEIDGNVCGVDPYAPNAWKIHIADVITLPVVGTSNETNDVTVAIPESGASPGTVATLQLLVGSGGKVQMHVVRYAPPASPAITWSPSSVDSTVPVEEDTSCPDSD